MLLLWLIITTDLVQAENAQETQAPNLLLREVDSPTTTIAMCKDEAETLVTLQKRKNAQISICLFHPKTSR
jgi:hypothetical protein